MKIFLKYLSSGFVLFAIFQLSSAALGGELRVMDFEDAATTSRCIGNPVTPLCAIETLEACRIRSKWNYCEMTGYDPGVLEGRVFDAYARLQYFRYEIIGRRVLETKDIPSWARNQGKKSWKTGDVAMQVWWQDCPPDDKCVMATLNDPTRIYGKGCRNFDRCSRFPSPRTYILRRNGGLWRLVVEYEEPDRQGDFWNRK